MSSLRTVEKKLFEDLFGMASGYVLDFTNNTFAEFFRETIETDIYSEVYSFNGDSKAKRLRAFWEVESDPVVGQVLSEMLEIWRYQNLQKQGKEDSRYVECLSIVEKLLGKEAKVEPEKEFLEQDFEGISLGELQINSGLIPVLEHRLAEANQCYKANAPLAVVLLCGSILEGVLLGVALEQPQDFNQAVSSPKDKSGKVKPFREWSLSQLIDVACELGFLRLDVKKFSHELRDFRNYIHPLQQVESNFQPDEHTAEICLQVLKAAIACLSGER